MVETRARRTGCRGGQEPFPPLKDLVSGDPVQVRKWLKSLYVRMPMKPTLMFLWLYVFKCGFLDGRAGYYFCRLRAMHELNVCAKIYEIQHVGFFAGENIGNTEDLISTPHEVVN